MALVRLAMVLPEIVFAPVAEQRIPYTVCEAAEEADVALMLFAVDKLPIVFVLMVVVPGPVLYMPQKFVAPPAVFAAVIDPMVLF